MNFKFFQEPKFMSFNPTSSPLNNIKMFGNNNKFQYNLIYTLQ